MPPGTTAALALLAAVAATAAAPPQPSSLIEEMLATASINASDWDYEGVLNCALFLLPDNRSTGAVFTYASYPASTLAHSVFVTTSTDSGRTFAAAVLQPAPAPWFPGLKIYAMPQIATLTDAQGASWANLIWNAYPLGRRSATARWNGSCFEWPASTAALVDVTNAEDGGINHAAISLRSRGRLFHISAGANMPNCKNCGVMGSFSDDKGMSWSHSATNVSVLHTVDTNGALYEADEPMTVELSNGTLWTLIRTNAGGNETMATSTLWEAFSDDGGENFRSPPTPSSLISWSSPVAIVRLERASRWLPAALDLAPLLLVWTNARTTQDYSQSTRSALHAALSFDDGRSFVGHREIMRDPRRKEAVFPDGDHGR